MHGLVLLTTLIRGGGGDQKHEIMDRPFRPKYGTMSQVLKWQLVVACLLVNSHSELHTSLDRVQRKSVYSLPFGQAVVSMYQTKSHFN